MNISPLQDSFLAGLFSPAQNKTQHSAGSDELTDNSIRDVVVVSDRARQFTGSLVDKQAATAFVAIPADQRPSAQESADAILGFIGQHLQRRADEGASDEELEKLFNQALKGFKQGFAEASKMIEGLGVMTEDVADSLQETRSLVLAGLDSLRETYLGDTDSNLKSTPTTSGETLVKQVSAYREQVSSVYSAAATGSSSDTGAGIRSIAALYAESYRSSASVDLAVKTRDGDLITLSFSSNTASSRGVAAFLSNAGSNSSGAGQSSEAAALYQSQQSVSSRFNFTVRGELDEGELDALNQLMAQVSELANEFFNGDFDQALALAGEFEMDATEFSALSLDIAASTQTELVEAYSGQNTFSSSDPAAGVKASGVELIGQLLDQLHDALDTAGRFAQPKSLLSDLLANQLAQHALLSPTFDGNALSRLFDNALGTMTV